MSGNSKKTQALILWVGVPAVIILVVLVVAMSRKKDPTVFTAKVERGDVVSIVTATGTINAVNSVQVGSQVSGNIDKLYADFNSKVKAGQLVAKIEPSLYQARYDQAVADVANAQANLKSLQVQVEVQKADIATQKANLERAKAQAVQAAADLKRTAGLTKEGVFAQAQLDISQANSDSAKAAVDAAQAQYEQSKSKLSYQMAQVEQARAQAGLKDAAVRAAKVDLDHTDIFTPINGTVVARNVDVGQTVAASLQAPTIFTIAEDLSKMYVYVATDESDVGNVKVGNVATFRVDAFPKDVFTGRITQVRINPTTVQNVVTYNTMIEFDNPDEKLLPGMTAYVTIPVDNASNVLKVPNGALRFKPDMTEEERQAEFKRAGIEMPSSGSRGMASGGEKKKDGGGPGGQGGPGPGGQGAPDRAARKDQKGGGDNGAAGGGMPAGAMRTRTVSNDIQFVWVQTADSSHPMRPVQVRTGITDYTYTAIKGVLKGELKEGDMVITGMAIPSRVATGQTAGPMGMGPGGMRKGK